MFGRINGAGGFLANPRRYVVRTAGRRAFNSARPFSRAGPIARQPLNAAFVSPECEAASCLNARNGSAVLEHPSRQRDGGHAASPAIDINAPQEIALNAHSNIMRGFPRLCQSLLRGIDRMTTKGASG